MLPKLITSQIRHQVTFAPDPARPSHGTSPVFVAERNPAILTEIPEGADKLHFRSVVESLVQTDEHGGTAVVMSEHFNEVFYAMTRDPDMVPRLENNDWVQVPVHPDLESNIWIFEPAQKSKSLAA